MISAKIRCEICRPYSMRDARQGTEIEHQPSFNALQSSAESGCDLCKLIYMLILSTHEDRVIEELRQGHAYGRPDDPDTIVRLRGRIWDQGVLPNRNDRVQVVVGKDFEYGPDYGVNSVSAELGVYAVNGAPPSRYIAGRPVAKDPKCDDTFVQIRNWMQNCDDNHDCRMKTLPPLPTRILKLDSGRLIVMETSGIHAPYVALSYCWGSSGKQVLLTQATNQEFQSVGIDLDLLPRTIQDAIYVTRKLGCQYIWIDALCIIQREPDYKDFKAEAPNMADYYSNAYLTLAIGSAADCNDGFLQQRPISEVGPCEIPYNKLSSAEPFGNIYLCQPIATTIGPIDTRAWTFQEAELSRRTLLFGECQMNFKCLLFTKYENGDQMPMANLSDNWSDSTVARPSLYAMTDPTNKVTHQTRTHLYRRWHLFVGRYVRRAVTNPWDKLAAIAGIAKRVQEILHGRYAYGLWEDDLVRGLLWKTYPPNSASVRRHALNWGIPALPKRIPGRAPSWSWASMDGWLQIEGRDRMETWLRDGENQRISAVSLARVSPSLDPLHEELKVPEAFEMQLRGALKRVRRSERTAHALGIDSGGWRYSSGHYPLVKSGITLPEPMTTEEWHRCGVGYCSIDDLDDCTAIETFALCVTSREGLLLDHIYGRRYRRVGFFTVKAEKWFDSGAAEDIVLI